MIVILVVAMLRLLPSDAHNFDNSKKRPRLDTSGAALVTASVAALIYGLTQGQERGFGQPLTVASLALAVVLAAGFVVTERRVTAPMVPFQVAALPLAAARLPGEIPQG